jgi:protein-L-isoaspartate(D-aspartate) O-methyltransferase
VLRRLGYENVRVIEGDGTLGHAAAAPYDAIVVTAQGPCVPPSLRSQLKPGGRLVMPLGESDFDQMLVRYTRLPDSGEALEKLFPVRFVRLIGAEGWPSALRSPIDQRDR